MAANGLILSHMMPWATNDPVQLEQAIIGTAISADFYNRRWAQKWFENFQFVLGNHYLKWSRQFDFAIDTDFLRNGNDTQKRSKTNLSRTVLESLASMIYSQLGQVDCESKYDSSSRGVRLARTVESLIDTYNERLNLHEEFDYGSVILVMFSKVYGAVTFHKSKGATFKRPRQQLKKVPKMTTIQQQDPLTGEPIVVPMPLLDPQTGQPILIDAWENVIGPDGNPVMEYAKNGDVDVEIHTPFEVASDPLAKTFAKSKWVERYRVMDYDVFMTEYGDEAGVLPEIDKVKPGFIAAPLRDMAMRQFLRSVFAVPPVLDFEGQINLSSLATLRNKVFVIEHYDRPTEGHRRNPTPWLTEGRRAVLANGRLVLRSTPQYRLNNDIGWHPLVEAKWMPLPPSTQSSGPMSDTVEKNRDLNLADSLISLALQRQAGSTLLVNENSGIDKKKWTGEPGMSFYVSGDPSAAVAYASDKNPVPAFVERYREQVKEDVYEVSGAQDSIRGERSLGATSGYQAELYTEREKARTSKASNNWESFVKNIYEKKIACLQQNIVKFDDSVVARMQRSTDGEVSLSDIYSFLNGPLDFGVDIKLKHDSMSTKSKASQIALIQEAMGNQAVAMRMMQDPGVVDNYLDFLGIDMLRDITADHRNRARKENAVFMDMLAFANAGQLMQAFGDDMPTVLWQDDDMVHITEHARDFIKNFDKYKRNPAVLRMFVIHQAYHEQNYKAKQDQQSPYIASTAAQMEMRAEQVAAQPHNVIQELQAFKHLQMMKAQIAQHQAALAGPAQAPQHPGAAPAAPQAPQQPQPPQGGQQ